MTANEQSLACIQFEHSHAVDIVDALLVVEEVDVFFIGLPDLSQSMGFPGNPQAELVTSAIDSTREKIVAAGRTPGMPAAANNVDKVLGSGVCCVYTHLPKILQAGASGLLQAVAHKSA